jgi:SIR2-like domain
VSSGIEEFFTREVTAQCIKTLHAANPLVVFVGAGVPASQGIPTWDQLLATLLREVASDSKWLSTPYTSDHDTQAARAAFVNNLLERYDSEYLGSLVRRTYTEDLSLYATVHDALYPKGRSQLLSDRRGRNFVRALGELVLQRHERNRRTIVLTTNFDDSLERAFMRDPQLSDRRLETGVERVVPVTGRVDDATFPADSLPIYHIHGFVPQEPHDYVGVWTPESENRIILSAHDFSRDWTDEWSGQLLEQYWEAQWFFVGMSFNDPHITFYLSHRRRTVGENDKRRPIGVFSRQGRDALPQREHNVAYAESLRTALLDAENQRLGEVGMLALPTTYHFEAAHFIWEIVCRGAAKNVQPLPVRQRRWYHDLEKRRLKGRESDEFRLTVADVLYQIRFAVEAVAGRSHEERIKAELWCLDPGRRALFPVGSSEHVIRDPLRTHRFEVSPSDESIAAVAAFTKGSPHSAPGPKEQVGSLWRTSLGIPIYLEGHRHHLPVGVLLLAGTRRRGSLVSQRQEVIERHLDQWLAALAQCLDPTAPLPPREGEETARRPGKDERVSSRRAARPANGRARLTARGP